MKRRYLVFLFATFFMFLYIGPVNLSPSSIPPAIVQRPQEVDVEDVQDLMLEDRSVVSTDISVVLAADTDDDNWEFSGKTHYTARTEMWLSWTAGPVGYVPLWRFQLTIPKDASITTATLSLYETVDGTAYDPGPYVWRINEDDVGPLEDDTIFPSRSNDTVEVWPAYNAAANHWTTGDVTDLVQEQVNLAGWASGQYIGFLMWWDSHHSVTQRYEDYQHANSNHAYMNITYEEEGVIPNWLDDFQYRKNHLVEQTAGADVNHTIALDIYAEIGNDNEGTIYLDENLVREGFDDIRFTDENNTELDYRFEEYYYGETSTDYFATGGGTFGWYQFCNPNAYYYQNRTYIAYQSGFFPHIIYYDHQNETWSPTYRIDNQGLTDDDHGPPAIWISNTGYIHVLYGAHNDPFYHARSTNPERIDQWTLLDEIGEVTDSWTYPSVVYDSVNDIVHLWFRSLSSPTGLSYINSTDNGVTWSDVQGLVTVDSSDYWTYKGIGMMDDINSEILHVSFLLYNITWKNLGNPVSYEDIRYFRLNTTDGEIYAADDTSLGTSITEPELDDIVALETEHASISASVVRVKDSVPYVVGYMTTGGTRTGKFSYWNVTANDWLGPYTIDTCYSLGSADLVVNDWNNITAFGSDTYDMSRYTWDGSSWTYQETIQEARSTYTLSWPSLPTNHNDTLQVVFTEYHGGQLSSANRLYAYGINGIVNKTSIIGAKFWVKIAENLSLADSSFYVYWGDPTVSTESTGFETSASPAPNHGYYNQTEYLDASPAYEGSITRFTESLPKDSMFLMDSEYGSNYVETFVDESDWTSGQGTPESDGDYMSVHVIGDVAYDYYVSNNISLTAGFYLFTLRYKGNVTDGSTYFRLQTFSEDDAAGSWTTAIDTTTTTGSWLVKEEYVSIDHAIESLRFNCIATTDDSQIDFDFLRVGNETGYCHDGSSDTIGISVSNGATVSTDGDYLSMIDDGDGSYVTFDIDWTSSAWDLTVDDYMFMEIDFHADDASDTVSIATYESSVWDSVEVTVPATDKLYNIRYNDRYVQQFRFQLYSGETVRLDSVRFYRIANWTITHRAVSNALWALDGTLRVDDDGALISTNSHQNWLELTYEPSISIDTNVYNSTLINRTRYSLETSYLNSSWSAWQLGCYYDATPPTTIIGFKIRLTNAGTLRSIIFGNRTIAGGGSLQQDPLAPVNYQAPTFDNPDDTDNMYARFKEYNITMYVSDPNGYADIDYLKLGFWDDGRSNNYARWRYDSPENTFVEEYDWDDYFELNLTKSEATKSGDVINCTFVFTVDWSCPDLTDVQMEVTVFDNNFLYDIDNHHFLTWDVETRLDFSAFSLDDGSGTVDRGDYDTLDGIVASGTIDYYGSAISPDSEEVDVWVSCSDVEGGPWSDTTLVDGVFSVTVDSDNVVGLDTYSFIVVEKGEGVGGSDLCHTSHSDTYIADRLIVDIQADDETPFNDQQVNFTLTIIYDYDDTVCSTYTIVVSRNAVWWHTFINGNKTLFNDTNSDVAYAYTTYDISESMHGLTKYSSGSESVTWSGAATTTTTTFPTTTVTETGIFYDLFLSLDMWGYLGPLGIVVIGYVLAKKDRGLGLIAFMVQCLIAAQYFALVSATPAYWWHIYIILFGGLFSCVIPLIDR